MAQITGPAGASLTSDLANYLDNQSGNVDTEQLREIINNYTTGEQLVTQGGAFVNNIYNRFTEFERITGKVEVVTTGIWSGDTGSLGTFFTSSTQPALDYYVNTYQADPSSSSTAESQYAIAYGNKYGSGSVSLANDDSATLPSKATYSQYRSILLEQDDEFFTFVSASAEVQHDSDEIYVINLNRSRYKEKMDPGNWKLTLSGSNGISTFIDDSGKKFSDTVGRSGRIFNVSSGSLNLGTQNDSTIESKTSANNGQGFGLFYPDQGIIVLNATAIHDTIGSSFTVSGSEQISLSEPYRGFEREGRNHFLLYNAIKGGGDFEARRTENVSTSHYFVRATNREYNYSNNPTFTSGSNNVLREPTFLTDPKTFVTTVGLYNDGNELLAVAKTSQPIAKDFSKELLIKCKLSF